MQRVERIRNFVQLTNPLCVGWTSRIHTRLIKISTGKFEIFPGTAVHLSIEDKPGYDGYVIHLDYLD